MTKVIGMMTEYAFLELHLHRIEANGMPRNRTLFRALEKNDYKEEGLAKAYLKINGVLEDYIHMVKLNKEV